MTSIILFEDDWGKHPTAQENLRTTNQSFVRLAHLYKKMGVRNHAFPLALINQNLVGINPFAPDLTLEERLAIAFECLQNPWFFFREIARAPGKAGDTAQPVQGNRANIALWWSFFNHILFLLVQPRQTGKSFSTDVLMIYLMYVLCQDTSINLLTKDDKLRRENIQRMKDIAEELPKYLFQKDATDVSNGEEITVNALGNHYNTHVPRSSEKMAMNLGRGLTTPIVHIDEPSFQPWIGVAVPAMLAGMGAVRERAQRAGAPYGVIMTTTAGPKDDRDGAWVYNNIVMQAAQWSERFLDARNLEELDNMVRRNSPGGKLQINGTFDHRMLGKDDKWLAQRIEESLQSGKAAERDYLNIWTSGGEGGPLSPEIKERISNSKRECMHQEIFPEGYVFRWYMPESDIPWRLTSGRFVLGVDTSEAAGRDDICLCMLDVETGEVVGAGSYNETNLITFSIWLAKFLIRYENVTAIIERRSTGGMIIDQLMLLMPRYGQDPFRRLFNRIVNDNGESDAATDRYREIRAPLQRRDQQFHTERKVYVGFATSGSGLTSRSGIYSAVLQEAAKKAGHKTYDPQLVTQILGLVIKNGRVDHGPDGHDDMVIAWLLAHWLLMRGQNLSYYGIETGSAYSGAQVDREETPAERAQRMEQAELRNKIEVLYEQLASEEDEWVSQRLEQQLRTLDRKIVLQDDEFFSLDALLKSAKDAKRMRRYGSNITNDYRPYSQGGIDLSAVRNPQNLSERFGEVHNYAG